mgnify:CR=1 FL=1
MVRGIFSIVAGTSVKGGRTWFAMVGILVGQHPSPCAPLKHLVDEWLQLLQRMCSLIHANPFLVFTRLSCSLMSGISLFVFHSRNTNKGIGIEVIHFLNDGLWQMKQLEK